MKSPKNLNSDAVAQLNHTFLHDIRTIITMAQANAVRSVEFHRVEMYWKLGERIFVEEQQEKERARQFYRLFPIASTLRTQLNAYLQWNEMIAYGEEK
jgi:hypothetical protein